MRKSDLLLNDNITKATLNQAAAVADIITLCSIGRCCCCNCHMYFIYHRCDWCGFEPHMGHKWDKSSSTCGCVRWFFPGYSRFRPTFWLARLDMSEIILKGTLNWTKKKKNVLYFAVAVIIIIISTWLRSCRCSHGHFDFILQLLL